MFFHPYAGIMKSSLKSSLKSFLKASVWSLMLVGFTGVPDVSQAQGGIDWQRMLGTQETPAAPAPATESPPAVDPETGEGASVASPSIQPQQPAWPPQEGQEEYRSPIDEKAKGYVSCEGAPKDAFTYIPDPFNGWMQLVCPRGKGHYISPVTGYSWTKTNGETFYVSATPGQDFTSRGLPENGYFGKIGVEQLVDRKRVSAGALFKDVTTRLVSTEAKKDEVEIDDYWRFNAINDKGRQIDLFFFLIRSVPKWFVYCVDNCKDYELVRINSANKVGPAGMPSLR